jgi:hypothetical protein
MTPRDDIPVRQRPRFPKRIASALIWLASPIANVIKASGPRSAIKGRTYGRTAPYGVELKETLDRGVVPHMGAARRWITTPISIG